MWATMIEHDRITEVVHITLGVDHAEPSDRCSYRRRSFHSKQLLKLGFSHHILSRQKLPKIPQGATVQGKRCSFKIFSLGLHLFGCSMVRSTRGLKLVLERVGVRSIVLICFTVVPGVFPTGSHPNGVQRTTIEPRNSWKAETRLSANPSSPTHTHRSY